MKNLWINKKAIISILLAGSIMVGASACGRVKDDTDDSKDNLSIQTSDVVDVVEDTIYIDKNNQVVDLNLLINSQYKTVSGFNKYTILPGTCIYYVEDYNSIAYEEMTHDSFMVTVLEANDNYSYCLFPNNTYGYVNNSSLIKCANLQNADYVDILENNEDTLSCNAYLYHSNGLYMGYLYEGQSCYSLSTNGEYTLIKLPDGTQGYVTNRALMGDYKKIDGYAFLKKNTPVYRDTNLTDLAYNDCDDQMVSVSFINRKYAGIFDEDGHDLLYVKVTDLDDDFILVDLDSQKMNCYIDYQLVGSWGTRSGKDSSPTHTGAFDIDWKQTDFEFENYPGSHAKFWIPINEYEEGIHDLVGDDEWNYGNQAYHQYGSHGCVRVPVAASEFVYENYEVGDMVLVRKK